MLTCAVYGCSNNSTENVDPTILFYFFPKHPLYAEQWVQACGWQSSEIDTNTARICSIHFDADSYRNEVKVIDNITCYSKILKYDAIPTLYLPVTTDDVQLVIKESNGDAEIKGIIVFAMPQDAVMATTTGHATEVVIESDGNSTKEYIELLQHVEQQPSTSDFKLEHDPDHHLIIINNPPHLLNETDPAHIKSTADLAALKEHNKLDVDIRHAERNIERLQSRLARLRNECAATDAEVRKYEQCRRLSLPDQTALLMKVFSEAQIKLLSGRKRIYWSNDDMAVGYTIRNLSNRRCYAYLTKHLHIPLPAVSSIKRWIAVKNRKPHIANKKV